MAYIIKGKIVAPHKDRREIAVNVRSECDKLPINEYPITHISCPEGKGVTLIDGVHECEASFHRYSNNTFYLGSASRRLGPLYDGTDFTKFLGRLGAIDTGTLVKLRFEGDRIYVDIFDDG